MRAIEHGLRFGAHGLPLMGSGDWNDGMNLVGREGKGESVWLALFLYDVLQRFADLAARRGDDEFADAVRRAGGEAAARTSRPHAWDGDWYRRAYFDDGTPLGSRPTTNARSTPSPELGGALGGRRSGARAAGDGRRWTSAWSAATRG